MKKSLSIFFILFLIIPHAHAQTWNAVGSAGFSAGRAGYTSIALDATSSPYVAYLDGGNDNKATVMKYNGSNWVNVGTAGFSAGEVGFTSIAIDKNGTPYMIQDIANYTEQIIQKFKTLGIETPDLRFNVYVSVINAGAAGKVDAGTYLAGRGYLYIDPYMITIDKELDKNRETMRMALAHEYMHFTQDYYI